ncbi:undecaprenyl-diphosphate phosphatase [Micromonospora sp. NPDC049679]|uniref:undecaprenyl-diphosphate phosphatase n=1 Tax=Micromonospora sp. NPDC049679 TaxID=3155920 RepID=UPI00340A77BC
MGWIEAVVLGIVQGLTEFLPISSSAHLRITSAIFFENDAGASFTAVTQLGTEAAVLLYFAKDIWRIAKTWVVGLWDKSVRSSHDYRMGWYVIVGSIPIGVIGLLLKDMIRGAARNLWVTAVVLIVFAFILAFAEYWGRQTRTLERLTMRDSVVMGFAQALAVIPGVSRSGGTLTAGLLLNLTREAAARFSFLLAIPAVVMSGVFSLPDVFDTSGGGSIPSGAQMIVATVIAFGVGYAAIAWLLRYVAHHSLYAFVLYRVALGSLVIALLMTGTISAT